MERATRLADFGHGHFASTRPEERPNLLIVLVSKAGDPIMAIEEHDGDEVLHDKLVTYHAFVIALRYVILVHVAAAAVAISWLAGTPPCRHSAPSRRGGRNAVAGRPPCRNHTVGR